MILKIRMSPNRLKQLHNLILNTRNLSCINFAPLNEHVEMALVLSYSKLQFFPVHLTVNYEEKRGKKIAFHVRHTRTYCMLINHANVQGAIPDINDGTLLSRLSSHRRKKLYDKYKHSNGDHREFVF